MKPDVLVFYAGLLYQASSHSEHFLARMAWPREIYNGCWIYLRTRKTFGTFGPEPGWYRADYTPVLLNDVPKETKTLLLLLGLA